MAVISPFVDDDDECSPPPSPPPSPPSVRSHPSREFEFDSALAEDEARFQALMAQPLSNFDEDCYEGVRSLCVCFNGIGCDTILLLLTLGVE